MTAKHGLWLEDLEVGAAAERTHTVTEHDILAFAEVSGDRNPLHLDEAFAATTQFEGRIAHGMLSAAYISAVLGTELPGPGAIYVSQTLDFKRPVRIGDEVTTRVEVAAIDEAKGHVTLTTQCRVRKKVAVGGEAVVLVARRNGGAG